MSEQLILTQTDKASRYKELVPQIAALTEGEPDIVANLSNISAALREAFGFFWVGFYLVRKDELVRGPFQGPIACTRIGFGKGVCGSAWKEKKTIIVPDVDLFPGHIACSNASRSEIVLPAMHNGEVSLVLDVDSDKVNDFDETDELYLQQVIVLIEKMI